MECCLMSNQAVVDSYYQHLCMATLLLTVILKNLLVGQNKGMFLCWYFSSYTLQFRHPLLLIFPPTLNLQCLSNNTKIARLWKTNLKETVFRMTCDMPNTLSKILNSFPWNPLKWIIYRRIVRIFLNNEMWNVSI